WNRCPVLIWPGPRKEDPVLLDWHHHPREVGQLIRSALADTMTPIGEQLEERAHLNLHGSPIFTAQGLPYQGELLQVGGKIICGIVRFEVGAQRVRDVVHPGGLSRSYGGCCRWVGMRGDRAIHDLGNA